MSTRGQPDRARDTSEDPSGQSDRATERRGRPLSDESRASRKASRKAISGVSRHPSDRQEWVRELGIDLSAMSYGEPQEEAEPAVAPTALSTVASRELVRRDVWRAMADGRLTIPMRVGSPAVDRIPYFRGHELAAERVCTLGLFQDARIIKVNPSLAQMALRKAVLRAGKTLIVPDPNLSQSQSFYILEGAGQTEKWCREAASKRGAARLGRAVGLTWPEGLRIDLCVVGSVAVTRQGVRLGKGRGLAEMEWGFLSRLGVVDPATPVLTTVHQAQIVSRARLPVSSQAEHDLPVDFIVTPKGVIPVQPRLPKPQCGILWDRVPAEALEAMPMLAAMQNLSLADS